MRKVYTFLGGHVTLIRPKMDGFLTTTFLVKNTLLKFDIDTIFDVFFMFFFEVSSFKLWRIILGIYVKFRGVALRGTPRKTP